MGKIWFAFTVMMIIGFIGGPLVYLLVEKPTPLVSSGAKIEYSVNYKYANGTTGTGTLTVAYSKSGSLFIMKVESDIPGVPNASNAVSESQPYSEYIVNVGNVTFSIAFPFMSLPTIDEILRNPQYTLVGYNTVHYVSVLRSSVGNDAANAEYIIEMGSNLIKSAKFNVIGIYDNGTWRAPTSTDYPNGTVTSLTLTLKKTPTAPRYIFGLGLYSTIFMLVGVVGLFGFLAILVVKTLMY